MKMILASLMLLPVLAHAADAAPAIPSWAHWLTGLVILPFVWPFIKKFLIGQVVKEFVALIEDGLVAGDEDDDALILAAVHWINRKCATLGAAGPARFKVFAVDLCSRAKFLKGREDIVAELAEGIVDGVGDAAKKLEKPAAVPCPPAAEANQAGAAPLDPPAVG